MNYIGQFGIPESRRSISENSFFDVGQARREKLECWQATSSTDMGSAIERIPEEQSTQRVLHPAAHLDKVTQDVAAGVLLRLDVDDSHGDEEIHPEDDIVRRKLVESKQIFC